MKKLWLDDLRPVPDKTWDKVKSYKEFTSYILKHGIPDIISFDHDLGREHYISYITNKKKHILEDFDTPNGYDCAKWLVDQEYTLKEFYCHSANPIGKINIMTLLNNWKNFYENKTNK